MTPSLQKTTNNSTVSSENSENDLWIAGIPMDLAWENPAENLRRMKLWIEATLDQNPNLPRKQLIFQFPELCLTGFVTHSPEKAALGRDSDEVHRVRKLAQEFGVHIVFGYPERNSPVPVGAVSRTNTRNFERDSSFTR